MRFIIKGKNRFNKVEQYGEFDNLRDCVVYLNKLKMSCVGETVRLWYEEVA